MPEPITPVARVGIALTPDQHAEIEAKAKTMNMSIEELAAVLLATGMQMWLLSPNLVLAMGEITEQFAHLQQRAADAEAKAEGGKEPEKYGRHLAGCASDRNGKCRVCYGTGQEESSNSTEEGWWECVSCGGTGKVECVCGLTALLAP